MLLVATIVADVFIRNIRPLSIFVHETWLHAYLSSSLLQELEWHIHSVFIGICIVYSVGVNSNVRIDIFSSSWSDGVRFLVDKIGWSLFALPFTCIVSYYLYKNSLFSYNVGESSTAAVGIDKRWIIKLLFAILFSLNILLIIGEIFSKRKNRND